MSVTDNLVRASSVAYMLNTQQYSPSCLQCKFITLLAESECPSLIGGCFYDSCQSPSGCHRDWCCLVAYVEGEQCVEVFFTRIFLMFVFLSQRFSCRDSNL